MSLGPAIQHEPFGDPQFEQLVRETAYYLWERDGYPEGAEKHYWYRALEKCLRRHDDELQAQRGLIDPI